MLLILNRITDAVVAFDAEMNYVYVNRRAGELLGHTPEELIGKNYWKEFPESKGTPFANACMKALETQAPMVFEDDNQQKGRWFENRIYPSKEGLTILLTDITERGKAAESARQQTRFISTFANTAPAIIYVYDLQTQSNVYANDGIERLLGYSPDEIKAMGAEEFTRLIHPDDLQHVMESQSKIAEVQDGEILEIEYRLCHKDGRWLALHSYESPFQRLPDGSVKQKIGVALDITERKQAEDALRESEKRNRIIAEMISDYAYIFLVTPEGELKGEWVTESFTKVFGYTLKEVQARGGWQSLVYPEDLLVAQAHVMKVARGEPDVCEMRWMTARGEIRWLRDYAKPIFDEAGKCVVRIYGASQDITERKRAEEKLRSLEERFSKAFHTSPAGMTITRISDGKFIDVNDSFLKMFEFNREEVIGHTSTELGMWTPEERKKLIEEQVKSGGLRNFELQAQAKSGRVVNILFSSAPIELGGDPHHVTTMIDITERKRAEAQLRALAGHLQNAIEEERARIAREIHDDIGQIFTAIKMDLSLLLRTLEGVKEKKVMTEIAEEVQALIGLLDRGVQSIRKVVRDLRPEVLETMGLLAGIEWQAREFEKRTKIRISLSLPKHNPKLEKPKIVALFRIVQEALTNVARHAQATKVKIQMTIDPTAVRLVIEDDGKGISENDINRPGSFGLIAMQERIHAMGGVITISGKAGKGTKVEVRLERNS